MLTRRDQILRMRESGLAQSKIGQIFGLSRERVRQIIENNGNRKMNRIDAEMPLSTGDVARLLNIHTNTVRRWCSEGLLKSYRVGPRGDRRIARNDVLKLISGV